MYAKLNLLQIGVVGVQPQIFFLETDATLSQITTVGYFNGILASSAYSASVGDVIVAKYLNQTQSAWFLISMSGSSFLLTPSGAGSITGGISLGGDDAIYAGVSGNNLTFKGLTAGSNITLTPSADYITIASSGGGGGFAYDNAYWVSQANGDDANAGTSIDTPFQTVQAAINAASTESTVIYVVDGNNSNNETIATLGTGQSIFIEAPGTSFQGSITQSSNDLIYINAFYVDAFVGNSSSQSFLLNGNYNVTTTSNGTVYATCNQFNGYHTGGASILLNCNELNGFTTDNSISSYIMSPFAQNITNAGAMNIWTNSSVGSALLSNTGTIQGVIGGVTFGESGVCAATESAPDYSWPTTGPTGAGQVPISNGAGPGATTSWGSGGGGGGFVYENAYWVSQNNGSDSNAGTSIDTPFLTVQAAINAAAMIGNSVIYVVDDFSNTETLTASSGVCIQAPGTSFQGSITTSGGGDFTLYCGNINTITIGNNSGAAARVFCNGDIANLAVGTFAGLVEIVAGNITSFSTDGSGVTVSIIAQSCTNMSILATDTVVVIASLVGGSNAGLLYLQSAQGNVTISGSGQTYGMQYQKTWGINIISDKFGNPMLELGTTSSPVNNVQISNAATGDAPSIAATGSDTNIDLLLSGKGTGGVDIVARTDGSSAPAGYVGEVVSLNIPVASAITLTDSTPADIGSITLSAGDWDVFGNVGVVCTLTELGTAAGWTSLTSATLPDSSNLTGQANTNMFTSSNEATPILNVNVSTTTTIYLTAFAEFGSGSTTAYGNIYARRMR